MANTTTRDGKRVAVGTAAAFDRLAAAFKKKFGLTLHVRSGLRTWQEQYNLWVKYKNGGTYALHPDSPQANHVEGNPSGGRSLDLYDSGKDAGVTVAGTRRANWLKANAAKYGFWARGYNFNEPWHVEYQGNPWAGPSFSGTPEGTTVATAKDIWYFPVHRKDGDVRVIQEIADIKTIVMKLDTVLATPVRRGGKEVSVRQDNADTNTFAREILKEVKALRKEIDEIKKKVK